VLTIADDLHARGVGVRILAGKLSGSYSPHGEGKFFFTMMAAFAVQIVTVPPSSSPSSTPPASQHVFRAVAACRKSGSGPVRAGVCS
jgi:hypothetical protein